jgi:hypothetical protein
MKYSRIGVMAGLCGLAFWGCMLPRRVPVGRCYSTVTGRRVDAY